VAVDFVTLIKFVFAVGSFVLLTRYGARSRRIAGVLLTFPILNGIALLTSPDPLRVAGAIYLLVMFNCLLFWVAISSVRWVPPRGNAFSDHTLLLIRLGIWGIVWVAFAYQLTDLRDQIPTKLLIAIYCGLAGCLTFCLWQRPPPIKEPKAASSPIWQSWVVRLALFTAVFFCILYVSQNASDQKWAGMASALPLPGLFALASLSVGSDEGQLMPIRDSVLLGPLLVIPFNWCFAEIVTSLPTGLIGILIAVAALVLAWSTALLLLIWLVPIVAHYLDSRRP
jgi:hypothetical protein